jgi:hypothetical protein
MDQLSPEFEEKVRREALHIRTDLVMEMQKPGERSSQMPMVWIDALPNPDVATLWQKHERYGEGNQEIRWLYFFDLQKPEESTFYLDIQVDIPRIPHLRYFVAFPVIEHEELLKRFTQAKEFSIITDPSDSYKQLMKGQEKRHLDLTQLNLLRQGLTYEHSNESDRQELSSMLKRWQRLMKQ